MSAALAHSCAHYFCSWNNIWVKVVQVSGNIIANRVCV